MGWIGEKSMFRHLVVLEYLVRVRGETYGCRQGQGQRSGYLIPSLIECLLH